MVENKYIQGPNTGMTLRPKNSTELAESAPVKKEGYKIITGANYPKALGALKRNGFDRPLTLSETIRCMVDAYESGDKSLYQSLYESRYGSERTMPRVRRLDTCTALAFPKQVPYKGKNDKLKMIDISDHLISLPENYSYKYGLPQFIAKLFNEDTYMMVRSENVHYDRLKGVEISDRLRMRGHAFGLIPYSGPANDTKEGVVPYILSDEILSTLVPDRELLETHLKIMQKYVCLHDDHFYSQTPVKLDDLLPWNVERIAPLFIGLDSRVAYIKNDLDCETNFIAADWRNLGTRSLAEIKKPKVMSNIVHAPASGYIKKDTPKTTYEFENSKKVSIEDGLGRKIEVEEKRIFRRKDE
jgi:hypothetical protein